MSIGGLTFFDYYTATVDIATSGRQSIIANFYIPLFSSLIDFNPAISIDLDADGTSPLLMLYFDNGPSVSSMNDAAVGQSGIGITGLQASWFSASAEQIGAHDGSSQHVRTGVGATTNALGILSTVNTADNFAKILFGTSGYFGQFPGRILNAAIVIDATDVQLDRMRGWGLNYWHDTLPDPYLSLIKWSRRFDTNLTTGIGAGDPVATGSPTISNASDPLLTPWATGSWASDGRGAF